MGRKALEAVFGALGGGLVGYGKDQKRRYDESQDEMDREAERERERVRNALTLSQMGFDPTEDLRRRSQTVSRSAQMAQGAPPVPGMPGMSAVASALSSGGRALDADISGGRKLTVEGKEYVQPFSRTTQGQAQSTARQAETERLRTQQGREEEMRLQTKLGIERDTAAEKGRQTTTQTRVNAATTPQDRVEQAVLQSVLKFSSTPIADGIGERFPNQREVDEHTQQAIRTMTAIYQPSAPPIRASTNLTSAPPIRASTDLTPNETVLKRQRDEAIAAVDARLISTAAKERAKKRIEDDYQDRLAQLGPR